MTKSKPLTAEQMEEMLSKPVEEWVLCKELADLMMDVRTHDDLEKDIDDFPDHKKTR